MNNLDQSPSSPHDLKALLVSFQNDPEVTHLQRGANYVLSLFRDASARVPAYAEYLAANGLNPSKIRDIGDWPSIPRTGKDEYLRKFSRGQLCWDGVFDKGAWRISTTSGSTGEPFYFPRTSEQDEQYALTAELYLRTQFKIEERSTLYIVAFPMGAWIGGVFTYEALRRVADNGKYALSIITPGINKLEIIKAVKNLGSEFDQVIIGSYAPFLKDIIDDGIREGLNWADYKMGFIFSAEAFSEDFRDYIVAKTGLTNVYTDTLNHYGTVDLGTMAHETPISVLIRRMASSRPALHEAIFGQVSKVPTLAQYVPEMFYFEEEDGQLLCTANSGYPLIRYDLKDHGGVLTMDRMIEIFKEHEIDLLEEAARVGIAETVWRLPFVFVYERSDLSVSFFAFQIYPETIKKALTKGFAEQLTGKFTMAVEYDGEGTQQLVINIELKPETADSVELTDAVVSALVDQLLRENSEYRRTHEEYQDRVYPLVKFWPYEDPTYFRPGTKQKWVKK